MIYTLRHGLQHCIADIELINVNCVISVIQYPHLHLLQYVRDLASLKSILFCRSRPGFCPARINFIFFLFVNEHIRIGSNSYENLGTFNYLGSLLTNQDSIREDIKCRITVRNACYYLVQILLSSLTNQDSIREDIKCRIKVRNACYDLVQILLSSVIN